MGTSITVGCLPRLEHETTRLIPAFLLLCLYLLVGAIAAATARWVKGTSPGVWLFGSVISVSTLCLAALLLRGGARRHRQF